MPFASPKMKRDYMRGWMRRKRATIPKKVRERPPPKAKHVVLSMVLCSHCGERIAFEEWGKGEHIPPKDITPEPALPAEP
jgi:hypothetical protein